MPGEPTNLLEPHSYAPPDRVLKKKACSWCGEIGKLKRLGRALYIMLERPRSGKTPIVNMDAVHCGACFQVVFFASGAQSPPQRITAKARKMIRDG